MADKKISELTELTTPDGTEELVVNDSGVSKKVQIDNLIADNGLSGDKIDGGTISNFTSTGIDDNATSTAITIDASENVGIGTSSPSQKLDVNGTIIASSTSSQGARIERNGTTGGANFDSVLASGSLHFRTGTTERMRVTANGLTFNGDTAAANALDDYEEGTWTPAVTFGGAASGVGYTANTNGRYVKVGGVVYVSGCLFLNNKGSSTGSASITGLPFAHLNSSEGTKGSGSIGQTNISFTAFPSILGSASVLSLFDTAADGTLAAIDNSNFANDSSVYFNVTYPAS